LNTDRLSMKDLSGLNVTVMGLGLNGGGIESARFLARHGAIVTVTDMKNEEELSASVAELEGLPIRYVLGRHEMSDFSDADLVIKNPAVRPDSPYLAAARAIETDISLFLRFTTAPIIAVTGSKGKSSVSSAIHFCLLRSGRKAFLGGNITVSPLRFIEDVADETPVVLELSSWQLADVRGKRVLNPAVAVITSIMPDHMNRYATMDDYVSDKRVIYENQGGSSYTICNHDDGWGHSFASETKGKVLWYSEHTTNLPGAWLEHVDEPRGVFSFSGKDEDSEILLPYKLSVIGSHQRKNMLCAALACRAFGIDASSIYSSIADFPGVEHRLERFAEKDGIIWYNDSAATIPQAVAAALDSFPGNVVLITGGTDKNIDFSPVRTSFKKAKSIILLEGSGTDKIIPILSDESISYHGPYSTIDHAVSKALEIAKPGDVVLLSPGCTSFGMFLHEFDRGAKFKEAVLRHINPVRS